MARDAVTETAYFTTASKQAWPLWHAGAGWLVSSCGGRLRCCRLEGYLRRTQLTSVVGAHTKRISVCPPASSRHNLPAARIRCPGKSDSDIRITASFCLFSFLKPDYQHVEVRIYFGDWDFDFHLFWGLLYFVFDNGFNLLIGQLSDMNPILANIYEGFCFCLMYFRLYFISTNIAAAQVGMPETWRVKLNANLREIKS